MMQYMKMSDEFTSEVRCEDGMLVTEDTYYANIYSDGDLICHAINSHDELVAEVERLRGSLTQCVNALYIAHKFCGNHTADECGDEIAIPISDALVAASKIVSE